MTERRIHVIRERGSYYMRLPQAAPFKPVPAWRTVLEILGWMLGVGLAIAILVVVFVGLPLLAGGAS